MHRKTIATTAAFLAGLLALTALPSFAAGELSFGTYLPLVMKAPAPTNTPWPTVAPTATTAPTSTPQPTATAAPTNAPTSVPQPTATPTLPPASFNNCQQDPNPGAAPGYPVRITAIDKNLETVTLKNVSASAVSLDSWHMCSITGNQEHSPIGGTLAPGASQTFGHTGGNIWNNSERDDGALYTSAGQLVSYWVDL